MVPTFAPPGSPHHHGVSSCRVDTRPDRFRKARSESEVPVESIRGTDGGDGAARAAELLNNSGNTRVGFARPRSRRDSVSVERAMRTHAERVVRFTRDAFDPSREALNYSKWSVERAQQACAEAARARERYEQLSSSS